LPTVVFYISGHGFGHASRQVEVINALGARGRGNRVVIRSAVSPELLERTVRGPYELRPGPCDTGVVQLDSVTHDDDATLRQAVEFHSTLTDRADAEARLLDRDVALVVGDIPPLAFEVAARLQVPAVAIANFTWDWIYADHPRTADAAPGLLTVIRTAYAKATLALELPFSAGFEVFPRTRPLPLIARHPTRGRDETRARFGLPPGRPAALLSFGGYGLPTLDVGSVDCLQDWTIVTTDRLASAPAAGGRHVLRLDERECFRAGYRYEDLVAAVDVAITKPGFGIIAECIAGDTSMLYTSRGRFPEYDRLVRELPHYVRSRFISQEDLFAGRWQAPLTALMSQPPPPRTMPTNGAEVAAGVINDMVTG
jgi:L-arabinokinase